MQKNGILKVVASTGGLRLLGDQEGLWHNRANKMTDGDLIQLKALKNKKVTITFNDKGKYINCEPFIEYNIDNSTDSIEPERSKPQQAKSDYVKKDTMITRQTCLKVAGEVMKTIPPGDNKDEAITATLKMAEDFEAWVTRK